MPKIQIDEKEILVTIGPKTVSPNGQIAIGRKHAGKQVKVYVVEVDEFEGRTIAMMKIPNSNGHGCRLEPYIKNPDGTVYRESDVGSGL